MRRYPQKSFRRKLLAGFLVVGILPLLLCTLLLLSVFGGALDQNAAEAARTQLGTMGKELDQHFAACDRAMETLAKDELVLGALGGRRADGDQSVYSVLFETTGGLLNEGDFSLFDRAGQRRYSTAGRPREKRLSTDWGVLRAAREVGGVVLRGVAYRSGSDVALESAVSVWEGGVLRGYVVMEMTSAQLEGMLDGKYSPTGGVALLDAHWRSLYSSRNLQAEALLPQLRERVLAQQPLAEAGGEFSYYVRPVSAAGLTLLIQQPKPLAAWMIRLLYLMTGVTILLCAGLCIMVSMGLSRQLFEPIRALNDAMGQVETGNLEVRVQSDRTDEMGQLAGRFNRMVERLGDYLAASLRQQQELNDARIRMMQAQLNPHFLYNALDTMKWLGKINQVPEVATISADLADILRSSISAAEFVALSDELALLERYVEIQKIRFPGKFDFVVEAGQGTAEVPVPKLMLQPLVENAIIHGFEDGSRGKITVTANLRGGALVVSVRDNGCGMSRESMKRFRAQAASGAGHLGLYNVDAILRLHYGQDCGLKFLPPRGPGTLIRITLPQTKSEVPEC